MRHLLNCLTWSWWQGPLCSWAAGALVLLTIAQTDWTALALLLPATLLALIATSQPTAALPWLPGSRIWHVPSGAADALLVLFGASLAVNVGARVVDAPVETTRVAAAVVGGVVLLIMGLLLSQRTSRHRRWSRDLGIEVEPGSVGFVPSPLVPVVAFIGVACFAALQIFAGIAVAGVVSKTAAAACLLWCLYAGGVLLRSVYVASQARGRATSWFAERLKREVPRAV